MKNHHAIIYTIIFLLLAVFGISATSETLTGKSIKELYKLALPKQEVSSYINNEKCRRREKIADLEYAIDPHLQKLAEHQQVCDSFVSDQLMLFIDIPNSDEAAKESAIKLDLKLKEFKKYGVQPIVVVEPVSEWGLVDFEEFQNGLYSPWINTFFKTLGNKGITSSEMGMWVIFPEANLPYWNHQSSNPKDFGTVINQYNKYLLKHIPYTNISLLFNSATFDNLDYEWSEGQYISFKKYLKNIEPGTIQSFGIQGFPWKTSADKAPVNIDDPDQFLAPDLAIEAANILGVKNIWFNTGTFSRKYTLDPNKTVVSSPEEREIILTKIITLAKKLDTKGYEVSINLFSEDKTTTDEATNWSYFDNGYGNLDDNARIYVDFIREIDEENIQLSIFDTTD